jgi:hypothetical protein
MSTPSETSLGFRELGVGFAVAAGLYLGLTDSNLDVLGDAGSSEASVETREAFGAPYEDTYARTDLAGKFVLTYIDPPFKQEETGNGFWGELNGDYAAYTPWGTDGCLGGGHYDIQEGARLTPTENGVAITPAIDPEWDDPAEFPPISFILGDGSYGGMIPNDVITVQVLRNEDCEIEKYNISQPDF